MQLRELKNQQLTYCTNVHPGETLSAVEELVVRHVAEVKRALAPAAPFGVGLRLAAAAADELAAPAKLDGFAQLLDEQGLYCFTLNGFPYGAFHGTRVKERVYLPDWLEPERLRYTRSLIDVLARLLPEGLAGSISTVPGCFKPRAAEEPRAALRITEALVEVAATLVALEREQGKRIALALEPEPACLLETTAEAIAFFEERVFSAAARERLAKLSGLSPAQAERALQRHLGVCLDTCHASVEFEEPLVAFRQLEAAGIAVPKIQLSCGLRLPSASAERLRALAGFDNDVYLHQTVACVDGRLVRFLDLPEALASELPEQSEWRVHFHVPIFERQLGVFESTQPDLLPLLAALAGRADCPHLEVETYTWDVLPERFRGLPLTEAIVRELEFVRAALFVA